MKLLPIYTKFDCIILIRVFPREMWASNYSDLLSVAVGRVTSPVLYQIASVLLMFVQNIATWKKYCEYFEERRESCDTPDEQLRYPGILELG